MNEKELLDAYKEKTSVASFIRRAKRASFQKDRQGRGVFACSVPGGISVETYDNFHNIEIRYLEFFKKLTLEEFLNII